MGAMSLDWRLKLSGSKETSSRETGQPQAVWENYLSNQEKELPSAAQKDNRMSSNLLKDIPGGPLVF